MTSKGTHLSEDELQQCLVTAATKVKAGALYVHYKNHQVYKILELVILEATDEPAVIYEAQYGERLKFCRPVASWIEEVMSGGVSVKRFSPLTTK